MSARRPKALVGAAIVSIAVLAGTPVNARTKQNNNHSSNFDQHFVGASSFGNQYHERRRVRSRPVARVQSSVSRYTDRSCLDAPTKALLNNLEARFGKVQLVKVCVPGARMPSGHVSWHARNKAFDFKVPRGVDQRDVMVWLTKNSPGVTISYRGALAGIIHTDTGSFKKVIYAAADHEAGHRAVEIWQERARLAALPPQRERKSQDRVLQNPAPWTVTAGYVEPDFESAVVDPLPLKPEPVTPDLRLVFWRSQAYVESKDIVVHRHVTYSCPGGKPLPAGLTTMLRDAAAHWRATVYVNSFYRSPAYNRKVGGARQSQHMKCRAVDFRVAGVTPRKLRDWLVVNRSQWGITAIGTYGTHTHADNGVRSKSTKLVEWTGGRSKRGTRYAKARKPSRYAAAG